MKFWRWLVIAALYIIPIAAFCTVGAVTVYRSEHYTWVWWVAPLCWIVAWLLTRTWPARLAPLSEDDFVAPEHWTARDQEAWTLVQAQQRRLDQISAEQLADPHFYLQSSMDLALSIAQHYHPGAKDPIGSVTVLDLLTAVQLAVEDCARWCRETLPGSHLLTVAQWRMLGQTPKWFGTAGNVAWGASVLINPLNLARFVISRFTTESVTRRLREQAFGWLYRVFIRCVGFYLIEMNSGRLRGGVARYRQLRPPLPGPPEQAPGDIDASRSTNAAHDTACEPPEEPVEVRIAVVGQVKAGKSSLINALLGHQQAEVDVLPRTQHVQQYTLQFPADGNADKPNAHSDRPAPAEPACARAADRLVLLDTAGYGDDGATRAQLAEMHEALHEADMVLLVMDAASPARRADVQMLADLDGWLQANLHRKLPPVLGVLTHIDCLRPALEWSPPYDWRSPSRPKETNIAGAVQYTREQFPSQLQAIVPVCTDLVQQRVWGVYDDLLPAMLEALGEARACALLRTLHAELDEGRVGLLVRQLGQACKGLLRAGLWGVRKAVS